MTDPISAIGALITAAARGWDYFSKQVDKYTERKKNAAYEEAKRRAFAEALKLHPHKGTLLDVLEDADERGDDSREVKVIRKTAKSMWPGAGKAAPSRTRGGGTKKKKAAPKKKKMVPARKKKTSTPRTKAAPKLALGSGVPKKRRTPPTGNAASKRAVKRKPAKKGTTRKTAKG